jgi:CubicO group peptidase (beta-lactamase class C family)
MGVFSPPGRVNTVRYILGQRLQFDPGTPVCDDEGNPPGCYDGTGYSNIGYLVLGLILEQESGEEYIDYVRAHVFGPIAGERGTDVESGRTFAVDQNPREPWYDDDSVAQNVFDPFGPPVFRPYGSWDHEARVGQGGQIAATEPLLKFLEHYYAAGAEIGEPTHGARATRNHTGRMPGGTSSLIRQRSDGVNYVALFNRRGTGGDAWASEVRTLLDAVIDGGGFSWPTHCIDGVWVDFDHSPSGAGNFGDPLNTIDDALARTPQDGRFQVKAGSSGWTGTIGQRVAIHAPTGLVSIGQ